MPLQQKEEQLKSPGAFFDSFDGKTSLVSDEWFWELQTQTQALLEPLRTGTFKRVKIAVLDTGVDLKQINFWDKVTSGRNPRIKSRKDFLDPDNKGRDWSGDGTHCVGIIRRVAPEADVYIARVAKSRHDGPDAAAVVEVKRNSFLGDH